MNFLAHAYLSFNEPGILEGNMISDFVKGKKQYEFPDRIQKGIRLHRSIDEFTDKHPATQEIKNFFRPAYRLYAGAFTDIVYDYFLANDVKEFATSEILDNFSMTTYLQLQQNMQALPLEFKHVFFYMQKHNWLYNYRLEEGIFKSFNGMASRAKYITESATACSVFINNISLMQPFYSEFFPLLKIHAANTLDELLYAD